MLKQAVIYDPLNEQDSGVVFTLDEFKEAIHAEQLITRSKGFETLEFVFPLDNKKSKYIRNERHVKIGNHTFIIRKITKEKTTSKYITVYCESLWYELNDGAPNVREWWTGSTQQILDRILDGTGWRYGIINRSKQHRFLAKDGSTKLYMLRYLAKLVECEIDFDTANKKVNFFTKKGTETNIVISYNRNLKGITRIDDTTQLCSRVYMYGSGGVTIGAINGGLPYIEDYSWFDNEGIPRRIMSTVITDERFSLLDSMLEYMQNYLATYAKPIVSYELEQYIVEEQLEIGDTVFVSDTELGKQETHRIIEREINLLYPEQSTYILDYAINELSDSLDEDNFEGYDYASEAEVAAVENDLQTHVSNGVIHITQANRDAWNGAVTMVNNIAPRVNSLDITVASNSSRISDLEITIADLEARVTALENA